MERGKGEEEAARSQTDENAQADAVDHQLLARLVERSEPVQNFSPAPPAQPVSFAEPVSSAQPRMKSSLPLMLAAGVLAILVIVGIGLYLGTKSSSPQPVPPVVPNGGGTNDGGDPSPEIKTKPEVLAVPGGTFQMGRTIDILPQEGPPHSVTVASFEMDKTEVTNAEYAEFVKEKNYTPPSHWSNGQPIGGQEQWPVNNVSLEDAKAFAAWRSKRDGATYRLPTEEEWEYAARGGELGNLYPWGNSWVSGRAATKDAGLSSVKAVGSYPEGKARWGHLDMIGNVWEWTSSKAAYYPGSKLTVEPTDRDSAVIRGGSLASDPVGSRPISATFRDWIAPTTKNKFLGFRLVRVEQ